MRLLTIRLFSSLAGSLFMALFALWAGAGLGPSVEGASYVMACQGVLSIVVAA